MVNATTGSRAKLERTTKFLNPERSSFPPPLSLSLSLSLSFVIRLNALSDYRVQFAGECFHLVSTAGSGSSPNRESNALHLITGDRPSPRQRATENIISGRTREQGRAGVPGGLIGSAFSSGHGGSRITRRLHLVGARAPLESSTSQLAPLRAKRERRRRAGKRRRE